ncbi:nucleotidyltransferase family protein [Alteromonas sp. ASW11-19]|uniref:Nucleotidyltransferase family protein n=1 Tax=Alteromonas salexigens TaxID=2982530 RepID=A0ABT2VP70_9ALTE|nr:nucleotidyltransferase family protein [Alteromonas salexigens]MCU7554036.1 nucleotidyltransferase family protein [Alteromonas salexigens]
MPFRLATLVLAGGQSARYGGNKLLSPHPEGQTLLGSVVAACAPLSALPVTVVTGAWHTDIAQAFADSGINLVENSNWAQGMGSSLALGVTTCITQYQPSHLLVVLGDLAAISQQSLRRLTEAARRSPQSLVVSEWEGRQGVPAIFPQCWFTTLTQLTGDEGARSAIRQSITVTPESVAAVAHPEAARDIDKPADWRQL